MAIKIKIPRKGNGGAGNGAPARRRLTRDPVVRAALVIFLIVAIGLGGAFCYYYIKYDRIIAQRFRSPVFGNSAKIYALPRTVHDGDKIEAKQIAALLLRAGYSDKDGQSPLGTFHLVSDGIEITP
ncbi:MAG: penicillin-binding protein, partial [Candidatus Sulfotelmatobacter sp.]